MEKLYFRDYILSVKPFLNLAAVCDAIGISRQAMYLFLKGIDSAISLDTLQLFIDFVSDL